MVRKKVVVLGGGTGMSNLLSGLKQYPLDITAVVSVCDDGGSTGKLREITSSSKIRASRKRKLEARSNRNL